MLWYWTPSILDSIICFKWYVSDSAITANRSLLAFNFLLKNHGYKIEDIKIGYIPGDITKLTDIESAELKRINHAMDRIQFNGYQLKDLMIKYGVKKLWS